MKRIRSSSKRKGKEEQDKGDGYRKKREQEGRVGGGVLSIISIGEDPFRSPHSISRNAREEADFQCASIMRRFRPLASGARLVSATIP